MSLIQFYCVVHRSGYIDPKHVLMAEFDETTGQLRSLTRSAPNAERGVIIRITMAEFKRQLHLHAIGHPRPNAAENRKKRNEAYRKKLAEQRPKRATRRVSKELRAQVLAQIAEGKSGVAISLDLGVSRSYVSRLRRAQQ